MNKSKIYFIYTIIVNLLLYISALVLFFDTLYVLDSLVQAIKVSIYGYSIQRFSFANYIMIPIFTILVSLGLITLSLPWGLWLRLWKKDRGRLVLIGIILSLTTLLISGMIFYYLFSLPGGGPNPL